MAGHKIVAVLILQITSSLPVPQFLTPAHVSPLSPQISAHPNAANTFLNPDCSIFSSAHPCAPGHTACELAYKQSGCGRRKRAAFPQFPGPAHVSPLAPQFSAHPNAAHTSLAKTTVSAHPNAAHTFVNPDCSRFSGAFPCAPGDSACETAYKASGCGRKKRCTQFAAHVSPLAPQVSAHPNAANTFLNPACARFSGAFPCAPGDSACEADYKASGCGRKKREAEDLAFQGKAHA